jgi:hypothetical protein
MSATPSILQVPSREIVRGFSLWRACAVGTSISCLTGRTTLPIGGADSAFPICWRPIRRCCRVTPRGRPRGADRSQSSGRSLAKTGIYQLSNYRQFLSKNAQIWRLETELTESTIGGAFLRVSGTAPDCLPGAEDSNLEWQSSKVMCCIADFGNQRLSPVREELQNLSSLKFLGPSKRWNFENRTKSAESRASEINGLSENNDRALPKRSPERT